MIASVGSERTSANGRNRHLALAISFPDDKCHVDARAAAQKSRTGRHRRQRPASVFSTVAHVVRSMTSILTRVGIIIVRNYLLHRAEGLFFFETMKDKYEMRDVSIRIVFGNMIFFRFLMFRKDSSIIELFLSF